MIWVMQKTQKTQDPNIEQVYLSGIAINSLIETLPSGTGYLIGIVMVVMMSGRLIKEKGSLARAVLPFVVQIKWGWHRVERAMERGKFSLDGMIEKAYEWCMNNLEVESVKIGSKGREVMSLDSSTIVRSRSQERKGSGLGKGYSHKTGRAVRANIVAALVSIAMIKGIKVGLLRSVKFGKSSEEAVENVFKEVAKISQNCLIIVDAGIASKEQFASATKEQALLGRLRINCKLRTAPPPANGKRGRDNIHGPVLHPGKGRPEVKPHEDFKISITRDKKKKPKRSKKIENIKNWQKTETVEIREGIREIV